MLFNTGEDKNQIQLIKTIYNNTTQPIASFSDTVIAYHTRLSFINMRGKHILGAVKYYTNELLMANMSKDNLISYQTLLSLPEDFVS